MALYEVEWSAHGTATVEADDIDEAEALVCEAVADFDHTMLDVINVDETEVLESKLAVDDD